MTAASANKSRPRRRRRRFFPYLWSRLVEDDCFTAAVVLSYTTLLALVPLTAVVLGVFSSLPVFAELTANVEDFVFNNLVPAAGDKVQEYVVDFAEKASDLSQVGTIFLLATALLLVAQIERQLNQIWRVRERRRWTSRILVYWAALTIGPLLLGASLAISSYLVSLPLVRTAASSVGARSLLLEAVPFLIVFIAFTLAYVIVPNTTVPWRYGLFGAIVASILFEVAKRGFAFFIARFPTYEVLYGALAAIPVFLAWVYLSWLVILIGASVAASLAGYRYEPRVEGWGREQEFLLLYVLVGHLREAQRQGETRSLDELLELEPGASSEQLERLLLALEGARVAARTEGGDWVLSRDPQELTVFELYRSEHFLLPSVEEFPEGREADLRPLKQALVPIGQHLRRALDVPVKGLEQAAADAESPRLEDAASGDGEPEAAGAPELEADTQASQRST